MPRDGNTPKYYEVRVREGNEYVFTKRFSTASEARKFVRERYPAYTPDYAGVRPPITDQYTNDMDVSDDTIISIYNLRPSPIRNRPRSAG